MFSTPPLLTEAPPCTSTEGDARGCHVSFFQYFPFIFPCCASTEGGASGYHVSRKGCLHKGRGGSHRSPASASRSFQRVPWRVQSVSLLASFFFSTSAAHGSHKSKPPRRWMVEKYIVIACFQGYHHAASFTRTRPGCWPASCSTLLTALLDEENSYPNRLCVLILFAASKSARVKLGLQK